MKRQARWAMIDNFDSFTYNLVQSFGRLGVTQMTVWRSDEVGVDEIYSFDPDGLVVSPGPNGPDEAGVSLCAVRSLMGRVPILGVCLGHQVIAQALGARIVRAPLVMHGKTSRIEHDGRGLFEGLPQGFVATRYHSLVVEEETLPREFDVSARSGAGEIMGIRHREFPVFGVQFHPESILTTEGEGLLKNFVRAVEEHRASDGAFGERKGP